MNPSAMRCIIDNMRMRYVCVCDAYACVMPIYSSMRQGDDYYDDDFVGTYMDRNPIGRNLHGPIRCVENWVFEFSSVQFSSVKVLARSQVPPGGGIT